MQKSESIKEIATALCTFQGAMNGITKDSTNPFYKSKFASLATIIEATRELLAKNGLSYAQFPTGENELMTVLMHTSGEWIQSSYQMTPVDSKPQSRGSALTYQRRYALCGILGLQVEDDDGNAASTKREVYDTSPIPHDSVPVVSYDDQDVPAQLPPPEDKPWKKKPMVVKTDLQIKKQIMELADKVVMVPLEKNEYKEWIESNTGLTLTSDNYAAIIERLTAMQ